MNQPTVLEEYVLIYLFQASELTQIQAKASYLFSEFRSFSKLHQKKTADAFLTSYAASFQTICHGHPYIVVERKDLHMIFFRLRKSIQNTKHKSLNPGLLAL